jgi:hypothetical protein
MAHVQSDGPVVRRVIAHVELASDAERRAKVDALRKGALARGPEKQARMERSIPDSATYKMTVTLAADLDDGRRVSAAGFGFGGPRTGLGAIWHRYRGPQLSDDPAENERLLDASYHVGLPDIADAVNQMLGRDPHQHRPPRLSWGHLRDALAEADIQMTEEELIAIPLELELSDLVKAEISLV